MATKPVAFAMAELLVQNGAEIPTQMPAIPLSPAAQLYIEQRTGRVSNIDHHKTQNTTGGQDSLSALPTIRGVSGSGAPVSVSGSVDGQNHESKLQKRGSAGSRFAGKVNILGSER